MDIFKLRDHARRQRLADRVEERDLVWERGPVAIVVHPESQPTTGVRIRIRDCRICGDRYCRCP